MYMEENGGVNSSGVTVVKSDEACGSYQVAPRSETTTYFPSISAVRPVPVVSVTLPSAEVKKKKRGRPRKYGPDGSITMALSPMPISASIPLSGDVPAWKHSGTPPVESFKKKQKFEVESPGEKEAHSVGANFTPHVITVNAGEDVAQKIISFAQQGSRAICVLAANGAISNVTLRQPNSSGGTLTYEGPFEILSLTGSFMLSDNGVTKSRSGGMSVSLSASDGRVMGGGLAGMLIAAGPVQVVVGSFVPGHQQEQKPKKQRIEHATAFAAIPATPVSEEQINGAYTSPSLNFASSTSFPGNNTVSINYSIQS